MRQEILELIKLLFTYSPKSGCTVLQKWDCIHCDTWYVKYGEKFGMSKRR